MNSEPENEKIRRLFRELRQAEEEAAPSFRQVMSRSKHRPARLPEMLYAMTGALVLLVAVAAGFWLAGGLTPSEPKTPQTYALLNWESPTDFLLNPPDEVLLTTVPVLEIGESVGLGLEVPEDQ